MTRVGVGALYDEQAERSVIGAMLLNRGAALEAIDNCQAGDFYTPLHGRLFSAIESLVESGTPIDYVTVASAAGDPGLVGQIAEIAIDCPSYTNVAHYAKIVYDKSQARTLYNTMEDAQGMLKLGENPYEIGSSVEKAITEMGSTRTEEPESLTIYEIAASMENNNDVVIPGMLNRGWRTIIVAPEGTGKSTLIRSIAISASQGYHPFSHGSIDPVRVLVIDLENPKEAIVETGLKLTDYLAGYIPDKFDAERIRYWRRPAGIDLRRPRDRSDLQREIIFQKPDLVCIGPVIKMYRRKSNESYEDSADDAMAVLDDLRTRYGFALMLEHHAAKGPKGSREMTPFGSQRFMSWPEVGISLYPDRDDPSILRVDRFRGDRLSGVTWPDKITRDRLWLFNGTWEHGVPENLRSHG